MEEKPNEALLIEAIALKNTGREMEALDAVNAVRAELSLPTATGLDGDVLIETCHQCLVGEAQLYPYYRLLQKSINYMATVAGFDAKKHFYLPIPQEALETDDTLTQNPEY